MANEKRLIDANALDLTFPLGDDLCGTLKRVGVEMAKARINDAPTVDAVEVTHGCWEPDPWHPGFVRCSFCHDCIIPANRADDETIRYCHCCGTRLKSEDGM